MRNLLNIRHAAYQLNSDLPLTAHSWGTATNSLICAFGPSAQKEVIELRRVQDQGARAQDESILIAAWDAPSPLPDLAIDKVVNLHRFGHSETSCLVLAGGDIVVVRSQPLPGQDKIEIVGSVDAGITAAAWSPDEELLAVATGADTLIFMTADFDSVANVSFNPEDAKLSKHVNVGWGKKETQFQGKRAKALRDPTMPEYVDEGTLSAFDDGRVTISWRGDGAYVAVNTIEGKSRRMIRVFSREGVLDSVTEPVDGLESALSWRPAGNLIAGIQRKDDIVKVVFFERNGLRHGQFPLRITAEETFSWGAQIDLQWNTDSSALAITYKDRIQIWTMGNYHYYLKQEEKFELDSDQGRPIVVWHPEQPLRLAVAPPSSAGNPSVRVLEYIFNVSRGSTSPPNDLGTTAVIDGRTIKLTPLRLANVPPPMAHVELELEYEAKDFAINQNNTRLAVLHNTSLSGLKYDAKSAVLTVDRIEDLPVSDYIVARQICYFGDRLLVLMANLLTNSNLIYDCTTRQEAQISGDENVLQMFSSLGHESLNVVTENEVKQVEVLEDSDEYAQTTIISTLPTTAPWVEVVHIDDQIIAFALTMSGTLLANERQLVKNCTSFVVTPSHLIYTTSNHLLKFVHLASEVIALQIPPDEPEHDERCRSIERGARLVNVMPSTYSLTLQMPRGNLETIYPRALVLAGVRRNIELKNYRKAFLACRSQRVDMNILHDHDPAAFLQNVGTFVDQLKKVEYIDLFLSQLRDEDVSLTMYKETQPHRADKATNGTLPLPNGTIQAPAVEAGDNSATGKVNRVCDAFLSVLESRYETNLQNVITAHVCKVPPNIEAGLSLISNLRSTHADLADEAIEHICFLVDVNRVYDAALGMYNLDLTLLVAQQSQKDPREYLPYLQTLQELPDLRRRFKIDDDLGRHSKALQHLFDLKAHPELQTYTQKHSLYPAALSLYRYDTPNQNVITRLYASYLSLHNRHKEAGLAYTSLSDHSSALPCYRAANLWRPALTSAMLIPLPAAELSALATDLADHLTETRDFASAAAIHLTHLSDLPNALKLYCRAYAFDEATRLAALHGRPELIESIIDPHLTEASGTLTELLAEMKSQLSAQVPRLRELRRLKAADPLAFFEGAVSGAADVPDNVSIAPSATSTAGGASLFTRYTGGSGATGTMNTATTRKTSKNRRREERKRARGKKGSVYEEEYLVNSIGRLIERVNEVGGDVGATVEALLGRGMRERARAVEGGMQEVAEMCEGCVGEVWEVGRRDAGVVGMMGQMSLDARAEGGEDGVRPTGGDAVLWDSLEQSWRKTGPPTIKKFERSGLLS